MYSDRQNNIYKFFVAGINYKKTDASIRGLFAINNDQYAAITDTANNFNVKEFFILSTCNRTEIYGLAENVTQLIELLCSQTAGSLEAFKESCYTYNKEEAVQHLFEVGAGLESQILGDYEIIGQLKSAVKFSKERGFVGAFIERLTNCVLQSTKHIKNETHLSGGTVSVSFSAVQYIKKNVENITSKNILLLGVGKIGRNTCKNLVDYLDTFNITLVNRSPEKANELANELGVQSASITGLDACIEKADIILVATNSNEPVILKRHVENKGPKLIIDLSIPYNVETAAQSLNNVTLINVDELSRLKDETLNKRMQEVPKAKAIIRQHKAEFIEWNEMRKNVRFIKAVKQKLHDMHYCEMFLSTYSSSSLPETCAEPVNQLAIKKVIKNMAVKLKQHHQPGCYYIEAINDFITTHRN